jgi:phage head maturation protease
LIESIKRGDIDKSSFGFTIDYVYDSSERVTKREDGVYVREILKFEKIIEMSPVSSIEAYPTSQVKIRSIDGEEKINDYINVYEYDLKLKNKKCLI